VKSLRFSPESVEELAEAAAWYASQRPELAEWFLEEIASALKSAQTRPASFPRLRDLPSDLAVRRVLLSKFPYAVLFLELDADIRIIAVAHLKREPDYWLNRLET
jgi:toxin ParE1/3/4